MDYYSGGLLANLKELSTNGISLSLSLPLETFAPILFEQINKQINKYWKLSELRKIKYSEGEYSIH